MSPSRAATAALVLTTIGTAAGIAYIHYDQSAERQRLHEGVIRDEELLKRKEAQISRNGGQLPSSSRG